MAKRTRRISTEQDFMSYKTDDLLFTCMILLATYDGDKLYLPKVKYIDKTSKAYLKKVLGCSQRTITRHLGVLKDRGLVEEDNENYYFPYEQGKKYQLIDYDMLRYLVDTGSTFIIQIYTYLHMKNLFKEDYEFTKKELLVSALGYSEGSENKNEYITINNCLACLVKQGILSYHQEQRNTIVNGKEIPTPVMVLDHLVIRGCDLGMTK